MPLVPVGREESKEEARRSVTEAPEPESKKESTYKMAWWMK